LFNLSLKICSLNAVVANLFDARAKLFGKTLQGAFFALVAKISKSSYSFVLQ
jgi:hypothetical protein